MILATISSILSVSNHNAFITGKKLRDILKDEQLMGHMTSSERKDVGLKIQSTASSLKTHNLSGIRFGQNLHLTTSAAYCSV